MAFVRAPKARRQTLCLKSESVASSPLSRTVRGKPGHTKKERDGFSFQVDDSATEVRFRLLIDGKPQTNRILIGAVARPAPSEVLTFPARAE